ncbi:MAG TPA: hypothetical protein VH299_07995 [Solirubrobacterales bacterium]|nr:hypothetical protein [Solirubrobacterales bacterium]
MAQLFAGGSDDRSPRRRWTDRIIGVLVGVALGLGVLVYFVFVHSEGTIDAPKINGAESGQTTGSSGKVPGEDLPAHPGSPEEPAEEGPKPGSKSKPKAKPVPVVKVIGGAPPAGAGPKQLNFTKGEKVSFEIDTDEPFSFEIKGLGITQSIESSSIISFEAKKAGQFPVIATATLIGVADLLVKK